MTKNACFCYNQQLLSFPGGVSAASDSPGDQVGTDQSIERIPAWSRKVHQDEDSQIDKRQFSACEWIAAVDNEKGDDKGENDGNEDQPIKCARDDTGRTDDLGEESQQEGGMPSETQWIGKSV